VSFEDFGEVRKVLGVQGLHCAEGNRAFLRITAGSLETLLKPSSRLWKGERGVIQAGQYFKGGVKLFKRGEVAYSEKYRTGSGVNFGVRALLNWILHMQGGGKRANAQKVPKG